MKPKSSSYHCLFCPGSAWFLPGCHQAGSNAELPTPEGGRREDNQEAEPLEEEPSPTFEPLEEPSPMFEPLEEPSPTF